jgi:hypothetical protein
MPQPFFTDPAFEFETRNVGPSKSFTLEQGEGLADCGGEHALARVRGAEPAGRHPH